MPFVLQKSKSGLSTLEINGRLLHSNYAPDKEALRFVNQFKTDDYPNLVILFGAGIGYLTKAVKIIFPNTRILSIYFDSRVFFEACKNKVISDYFWHPDVNQSLLECLNVSIKDYDFMRIKVIKWGPSIQTFPEMAQKALESLNHCLNQIKGSINTIQGFGKKWITNSFMNYVSIPNMISGPIISSKKFPVLLASGPSLIKSLAFIKQNRLLIQLIALPSSLSVLSELDLTPDVVVVTDPGFYSAYHFRFQKKQAPLIAMPLSAATGLEKYTTNFHIFQQPHFFEEQLLTTLNTTYQLIEPQGTVAASALALILSQTVSPCFVTGLDLAFKDIHSHAHPNSFYNLQVLKSDRMNPLLLKLFKNAIYNSHKNPTNNLRCSQSLNIYADYFNNMPDSIKSRVLIPDEQFMLKGFRIFKAEHFSVRKYDSDSMEYRVVKDLPSLESRRIMALEVLNKWQKNISNSSIEISKDLEEFYFFVDPENFMNLKHHEQYNSKIEFKKTLIELNKECSDFIGYLKNKVSSFKEKQ